MTVAGRLQLGRVGIWSDWLRDLDGCAAMAEAAPELERLGYATLWIPGGPGRSIFEAAADLLRETVRARVVTAIVSIWLHEASETAAAHERMARDHPGRVLIGLGIGHREVVERAAAGSFRAPLERLNLYLDELDRAAPPLGREQRLLAALGPRMLECAARRTLGAIPYLVTPEHTLRAREILGEEALLAPAQLVALDEDRDRAREHARSHVAAYLQLRSYRASLLRLGFTERDLEGGGSDRLIEELVACGGADAVARRVRSHLDAGADHVAIRIIERDPAQPPIEEWRLLGTALAL